MTPNIERAATAAIETLIKNRITSAPIMPLPAMKRLPNVLVLSFAEMAGRFGMDRDSLLTSFAMENRDVATSVREAEDGTLRYVVAYNQRLPFYMLQRALARELGHIVLGHDGSRPEDVRQEEAVCFARHLLCPRPLIAAIMEADIPLTVETLGNITGCYERCIAGIRRTPGVHVAPELNRMVREQFADYVHNFVDCRSIITGEDESPLVDFGTYMDNYED